MTPCCALRSGGDFGPEHAQWLARQVPGLVCLSDAPVPGVETIPLAHDWPGWWSKMSMFGPALSGDVLMMDLDTVVLRLPEASETTVLDNYVEPGWMGSGLMFVTAADRARVWDAWISDPAKHMRECQRWPKWGDQGFLQDYLGKSARWGANVRSYKQHCQGGLPEGTDVVVFHGKPRPWAVRVSWVPPLYGKPALRDFRELLLQHPGRRFIVMGGGPSLETDLDALGRKAGDVVISTNGHGVGLRKPDYLLAIDHTHTGRQVPMGQYLRQRSEAPIISPHGFADYRLGFWPEHPRFVLSGLVATWAAFVMGAKVVCLAGMDGYEDNDYTDEARKVARDVHCPVRVQPASFLREVWPVFDKAERFGKYAPHGSIDGMRGIDNSVRVRARKPCTVGAVELSRGQEMTAMRHEVARLLRHRMLEEV